jgi:spermidine synthase
VTPHLARSTSDRGEVVLSRRGPALELRVNGIFVMDDLETGSESELARAALAVVDVPRDVLVGGLGLGFTAHEVLADPRVERLVVVEIEDALVGWMRDGTVPHGPAFLADERLTVTVGDVRLVIEEAAPGSLDLVLLDVDNGPDHLVYDGNAAVYQSPFLSAVERALRPGGAVVIWSASESPSLQEAVAAVFGNCEARPFAVRLQTREEHYWLYLGRLGLTV